MGCRRPKAYGGQRQAADRGHRCHLSVDRYLSALRVTSIATIASPASGAVPTIAARSPVSAILTGSSMAAALALLITPAMSTLFTRFSVRRHWASILTVLGAGRDRRPPTGSAEGRAQERRNGQSEQCPAYPAIDHIFLSPIRRF